MEINDLDIILFRGESCVYSYLIEWLTWSRFSHVGIILKDPIYINPKLIGTYLLESGLEYINGVQITDWNSIYSGYTGEIWKRSLNPYEEKVVIQELLTKVHDVIHNKPYDTKILDLIRIGIEKKWGNCREKNRFVCSALITFILVSLELLDSKTEWDLIQPRHFDVNQWIEKNIQNCDFGELVKIK